MIADLSIHNVEEVHIGSISASSSAGIGVHREIKIHTKEGVFTITLWGRCNPQDEDHTTLDITL